MSKKLSIASLVLGIVAIAGTTILNCLCGCLGSTPAFICAIVGIVLSAVNMSNAKKAGVPVDKMNIAGLVLSIVALVLGLVIVIINAAVGAAAALGSMDW